MFEEKHDWRAFFVEVSPMMGKMELTIGEILPKYDILLKFSINYEKSIGKGSKMLFES